MEGREPDNVIELTSGTIFIEYVDDLSRKRYIVYKMVVEDKLKLTHGYLIDVKWSSGFPLYEHTYKNILKLIQ